MGCSVSVYVVYGVECQLSDLVEMKTSEKMAECHPDRFTKDDNFCPECGDEVIQKTSVAQVKEAYQELLPEYGYYNMGMAIAEWLEYAKFPETSLDVVGGWSKSDICVIGKLLDKTSDVMYGNSRDHVMRLDGVDTENSDLDAFLTCLGFDKEDIGVFVVPSVSY